MYQLEKTRLIREGVSFPIATELAYEYVRSEERKERELIGENLLSPKNS